MFEAGQPSFSSAAIQAQPLPPQVTEVENVLDTVVFTAQSEQSVNFAGPLGDHVTFTQFKIALHYKILAANWNAGLAIPLKVRIRSNTDPINGGFVTDYFSIVYNGAVEAYVNHEMQLSKNLFFTMGKNVPQTFSYLISVCSGVGNAANYTGTVHVNYDYTYSET